MVKLYQIKASPGKGNGVFARREISPGTVILKEFPLMEINRRGLDIKADDVQRAFNGLNSNEQAAFLSLHESTRPLETKLQRIYKANCFGDTITTYLFLEISRINHSCIPNAERVESDKESHIVALEPITKGEEISINYRDCLAHCATASQRGNLLRVYYNFTCTCATCTLPPKTLAMSNARRQLIHAVYFPLKGYKVPDFGPLDAITPEMIEREGYRGGVARRDLYASLTRQRRCAYNILFAKLLEAEGLGGTELVEAYFHAAVDLIYQMGGLLTDDRIIVLDSVRYVQSWMETAAGMAVGQQAQELSGLWKKMKEEQCFRLGHNFIMSSQFHGCVTIKMHNSPGPSFALLWLSEGLTPITKQVCHDLLRGMVDRDHISQQLKLCHKNAVRFQADESGIFVPLPAH